MLHTPSSHLLSRANSSHRFLAGVGVGAISVLVPMYQSEMAPKWIRGTLVCAYQLSITVGLLSASVINIITSKIDNSSAYRIPLGLQLVPALILTAGMLVLPETPRFLVKMGQKEAAGLSLSRLRRLDITHPALIEELHEMIANHQYELTLGPASYKDLFTGTPHLGRRTFTGCGLQMLQQLTGINFIMYYGTTFFGRAGIDSPYTKSLIINVINVVSTLPGLFIIESWGRRKLLMVGAIGMAACQLLMATFATAAGDDLVRATQNILVVFCSLNIFFFAASWGPVVWVVTSEIYPLKIRAKAMSVSTAANWVLNFGIAYSTPFMVDEGPGNAGFGPKIFFIWGAFCIVGVLFVWCMVYETSKISLSRLMKCTSESTTPGTARLSSPAGASSRLSTRAGHQAPFHLSGMSCRRRHRKPAAPTQRWATRHLPLLYRSRIILATIIHQKKARRLYL